MQDETLFGLLNIVVSVLMPFLKTNKHDSAAVSSKGRLERALSETWSLNVTRRLAGNLKEVGLEW